MFIHYLKIVSRPKSPAFIYLIHHVFQLVLSRMQGLPDTLRKQDLMSQSLLPKCHSTTCDNHHLPALILQHGHLTGYIKTIALKYFFHNQDQEPTQPSSRDFFSYVPQQYFHGALPALLWRPGVPVPDHTHPESPQHSPASLQSVWPASTHCGGQKTSHGDAGARLQGKSKSHQHAKICSFAWRYTKMVRIFFTSDMTIRAGWLLTFSLGKCSAGDRTDIWLPDSGWQARAWGQPGKHGTDTLGQLW